MHFFTCQPCYIFLQDDYLSCSLKHSEFVDYLICPEGLIKTMENKYFLTNYEKTVYEYKSGAA
jgi:hypothetical protein